MAMPPHAAALQRDMGLDPTDPEVSDLPPVSIDSMDGRQTTTRNTSIDSQPGSPHSFSLDLEDNLKTPLQNMRTERDLQNTFRESKVSQSEDGKGRKKKALTVGESRDWFKLWVYKTVPILNWGRTYSFRESFGTDAVAGVIMAIMLVPQGMAYGMLAGMPPVYGLYSSISPSLVYLCLGTCKHLQLGTNAPISLLVADGIAASVPGLNEEETVNATLVLCFMCGVIYLIMRALQLAIVTAFIPDPVLSGFCTGAAFLIITSNMKYFLGLELARGTVPETWASIISQADKINWISFGMGATGLLMLFGIKELNIRWKKKYKLKIPIPEQLIVLVLASVITYACELDQHIDVVGHIPGGLYTPQMPKMTLELMEKLLTPAITTSIVSYIITVQVGKSLANKHNYNVDPNQELVAIGMASLIGSVCGSYSPSGSFSRSALVAVVGAESPLHNLITGVVLLLVITCLTPLLYYLPKCILASIIFQALKTMINFTQARFLWGVSKGEWVLWTIAFVSTVAFGVTVGIGISMAAAIIILLQQQTRPATAVLGRLPGTMIYKNVERFQQAKEVEGVKIFRFDAALHFANKDYFEEQLLGLETKYNDTFIHTVVVDASSVNSIDTSSVKMLERVAQRYHDKHVELLFANWKGPMRTLLDKLEFWKTVPMDKMFLSLHDAVMSAQATGVRKRIVEVTPSGEQLTWDVMIDKNKLDPRGSHNNLQSLDEPQPNSPQQDTNYGSNYPTSP